MDYRVGYNLAMENAKAHLKAAEILVDNVNRGIANSHLILAAEEAVKAYVIFAKHLDSEAKFEDFNKFFSDHKHKHQMIKETMFFLKKMMAGFKIAVMPALKLKVASKNTASSSEYADKIREGFKNLNSWVETQPSIDKNEEWWQHANNNKNRGFYVGIKGGRWESPGEITNEDFNISKEIVKETIELAETCHEVEMDEKAMELFRELK